MLGKPPTKFEEIVRLRSRELESIMKQGIKPVPELLAGCEFRGFNILRVSWLLGFQKFVKGFWIDESGDLFGYNLFVRDARGGVAAPWQPKASGPYQGRHGFYRVEREGRSRYSDYQNAVLLNYGIGRNHVLNPERLIRDYLVQVSPEHDGLFLGKAYLDFGLFRLFSNFFLLERMRRT